MITSIEIAKILKAQRLKQHKKSSSFDSSLLGLGIRSKVKTKVLVKK